jgi:hypothetical protein
MPSFAAFRYRNILAAHGGPISALESGTFTCRFTGAALHQVNATLRPDLAPARRSVLFSPVDGTGTHPNPSIARHIALSEALERWAHLDLLRATPTTRARYAFDIDPTSNGMSAFPGLLPREARQAAYLEAIERYCLLAWWDGLLPARYRDSPFPTLGAAEILSPFPSATTVILFTQTPSGRYAYGHAAAPTFERACAKALIELDRHELAVERFTGEHSPTTLGERRALFFSTPDGFARFWEKVDGVRGSGFGVRPITPHRFRWPYPRPLVPLRNRLARRHRTTLLTFPGFRRSDLLLVKTNPVATTA